MPIKSICVLACFAACLFVSSKADADVFSDDFEDGADVLWANDSGDWNASGGVYRATSPNNFPNAHSSLPFALSDFNVDVDVNDVTDGGIWLRSSGASATSIGRTGVLLVVGVNGGLYWHTVTNGNSYGSSLNAVTGLFGSGDDPHLRVEVAGDNYSVFINGSTIAATSLTTANFSIGEVALYDNSSAQSFDNFVISVPEPASGVVLGLFLGASVLVRRKR